jgi:hypothetical protein
MGVTSVQGFKFKIVANGEILDLFHDETIYLSDNITGLFVLGVLPADFTRQLTLSGIKKNNHFFEFVYDISVENPFTFSTNQKVQCYLDFDGIYLSSGYMQLNKVNVLANKFIDSYEVTIYGGLASFGRDLKRYFLTDLTGSLAQFNHTASFDNIVNSWEGNLFSGSIVYPMAEYGQKISYTPSQAYSGIDSPEGALCVEDYKPAIRLKEVWDAIFTQFGYTYTSAFWEQSWLDNVYLIANNKLRYPIFEDINLETYGLFKIAPASGSGVGTHLTNGVARELPWYNILQNPNGNMAPNLVYSLDFSSKLRGDINLCFQMQSTGVGNGVPQFNIIVKDLGGTTVSSTPLYEINNYMKEIQTYNNPQTKTQTFELLTQWTTDTIPSGSYQFFIQYNALTSANFDITLDPTEPKSYLSLTKVDQGADGRIMNIGLNMPFGTAGIKLIDFIVGIQKKFNLVMYPNKTKLNDFIVEPFNQWYKQGVIRDFNKYINLDEKIQVVPANNFAVQNLNFGDTLDGDYISQQFAKGAAREFGKAYYIDTQNFFSQGDYTVKTTLASSPLVYLQGTGVSASVAPPPVAYPIGDGSLSYSSNLTTVCSIPNVYSLYSSTGTVAPSAVLYYDANGDVVVTGYRFLVHECDIWQINQTTGVILSYIGNCTDYGGCI